MLRIRHHLLLFLLVVVWFQFRKHRGQSLLNRAGVSAPHDVLAGLVGVDLSTHDPFTGRVRAGTVRGHISQSAVHS